MASLPKEHSGLYFDKLIRTQKSESLLALIMASYYGHKASSTDTKNEVIKRLVAGYNLFRANPKGTTSGSGTYAGTPEQFASQYTLGHEMAIWKDSDLNLTNLATKVATNLISVKSYLSVVFLNYIQPINGKIIHPLFQILSYMKNNGTKYIDKMKFSNALNCTCDNENINGLYNLLKDTLYFDADDSLLILNQKFDLDSLLQLCNKKYLSEGGYDSAKAELNDSTKYEEYIATNENSIIYGMKEKNKYEYVDLSFDEIVKALTDCINHYEEKILAIHMFGIKYGQCIRKNKYSISDIIQQAKINDSYFAEINKGIKLSNYVYEKEEGSISELVNSYGETLSDFKSKEIFDYLCEDKSGVNLVVYGTPGCGKSYYVQHTLLMKGGYRFDDNGTTCLDAIRTTFYQDYTNTDFVGQIMPIVNGDGSVTYEFNPGPFTLALNKAIQNPDKPIALVIEELNRGNAASIFGDIFQLLDRENGTSVYNITNVNVQKYLNDQNPDKKFDYIKLPSNLSIFATMNTSDQNVFTLDTAFKRRWKFEKIKNSFDNNHPFKDLFIPGMAIDWEEFCDAINEFILTSDSFINSEDKQLGVYFVDEKGLRKDIADASTEKSRKEFAYKVFEYLWDDVAKYNRADWFGNIKSLDELIDTYVEKGDGDTNGKEVFTKNIFK